MSTTWYVTGGWRNDTEIEAVQVERFTEHNVWIHDANRDSTRPHKRQTRWEKYWQSWDEAVNSKRKTHEGKVAAAKRDLKRAIKDHREFEDWLEKQP